MKRRIIEEMVAARTQSQADANQAIEEVFGAVSKALVVDRSVSVPGFGTFRLEHRDTRDCRDPRNGERVVVTGKDVIKFREPRRRTR